MKFSITNGVRVVEVPAKDFRVILYDAKKKAMGPNRCTGGYFGKYKDEDGEQYILPAGHVVCDFEATNERVRLRCEQRGTFKGGRLHYTTTLNGRPLSTLIVRSGIANIREVSAAPSVCTYAISGLPVLRNGSAVGYEAALAQGWDGSPVRPTYHIFVGVKSSNADTVYVLGMKTTTGNLLESGEAARKCKALGLRDVIKLDGGGSYYINAGGNIQTTAENRHICTILDFGPLEGNPYAAPAGTLYPGSSNTTGVCWLQWELNDRGYRCELDGSFGPKTKAQLEAYQAANGLKVDGICGPATLASLRRK